MEEGFEILPPFFFRSIVEHYHDDERLKHNGLEYTPHKKDITYDHRSARSRSAGTQNN